MSRTVLILVAFLSMFAQANQGPDADGTARLDEPSQSARGTTERLYGVPAAMESLIVNDRRDIEDHLPDLAPNPATTFRFEYVSERTFWKKRGPFSVYRYRQWIHDVATENLVRFTVHLPSRRLVDMAGKVRMDADIPVVPELDETVAVTATRAYLEQGPERFYAVPLDQDGPYEVHKLLRDGVLWWGVGVPLLQEAPDGATQEWFWVDPDGEASLWLYESSAH